MLGRLKQLNQSGDTIVEVLLAVIVLSSVLVGAYQVASRASKENIQSQEHSQALQVAQGQLEVLKSLSKDPSSIASPFCFDAANGNTLIDDTSRFNDLTKPDASNYPDGCSQNLTGGSCSESTCFFVAITRDKPSTDPNLYTATVRWNGINGGTDQVSLTYRLTP